MNANGSPENTEWSFGRTEDLSLVDYQPWQAAIGGQNLEGFRPVYVFTPN